MKTEAKKLLNLFHLKKAKITSLNDFVDENYMRLKVQNSQSFSQKRDSLHVFQTEKDNFPFKGLIFVLELNSHPGWEKQINLFSKRQVTMPEKKFRAVIIFSFEKEYYALSYNRGDIILKSEAIDTSFGMNISKLLLSKDQLNNITTFHAWSNPPLNYTVYSPQKSSIPLYKQSINNDFIIVNKISGNSIIEIHNSNGEILQLNTKIIGNTSLHLEGASLLEKNLLTIMKALKIVINSKEKNSLTWTSEISQLKETKKCNTKLNNKLHSLINIFEKNNGELKKGSLKNICFLKDPTNTDLASTFTIRNVRVDNTKKFYNLNDLEHWQRIISTLSKSNDLSPLDSFSKLKLVEYDENNDKISEKNLFNFLYFNYKRAENFFFLYSGKWYCIPIDLTEKITTSVKSIPIYTNDQFRPRDKRTDLDDNTCRPTENAYTEKICAINPNLIKLDKDTFKPSINLENNHGSIEICDIFEIKDDRLNFICLKPGTSGQSFSHLIAQARNSAMYLSNLNNTEISKFINSQCAEKVDLTSKKINIILGIIHNKINDTNNIDLSLFPIMSLISIYVLKKDLEQKNIELELLLIPSN